jgi:exodeoxyribonuclease V alpha subunit
MTINLFNFREGRKLLPSTPVQWPLLQRLIELGALAEIDRFFAGRTLASIPGKGEAEALLLSTLMAVSRQGHLCLKIDEEGIAPSLDSLISDPGLKEEWEKLLLQASKEELGPLVCRLGSSFYLKRNLQFERRFVTHLERLMRTPSSFTLSPFMEEESLNSDQKRALSSVMQSSLTLITGGPGTGKTYLASRIAHLFIEAGAKALLSAPTGKAAEQLQKGIGQRGAAGGTLHSLLSLRPQEKTTHSFLSADLLIVDECSMIDAQLFAQLFAAIKGGTKVILMGDGDQLPAVEAGSLFADLIDCLPHCCLKQCMRTDRKEIIDFAAAIKEGKSSDALASFGEGVKRLEIDLAAPHHKLAYDLLWRLVNESSYQLLSCVRKGPFGVDTLNQMLYTRFLNKPPIEGKWKLPILIVRTDTKMELCNGEMGQLILDEEKKPLAAEFEGGRTIPAAQLPRYEVAFCLSVHKSQGSEYERVALLVPPGSEVFGREVLYTAATRARRELQIAVSDETLHSAVEHSSRRASNLKELLSGSANREA